MKNKQTNKPNDKQTQAVSNSSEIKEMEGRQGQHFQFFLFLHQRGTTTHKKKGERVWLNGGLNGS